MQIDFNVQIWREGNQYVAHATPLDVASCGARPAEARQALDEAVNLFLATAEQHGTLEEVLQEAGYVLEAGRWVSPAWVAWERHSALVGA